VGKAGAHSYRSWKSWLWLLEEGGLFWLPRSSRVVEIKRAMVRYPFCRGVTSVAGCFEFLWCIGLCMPLQLLPRAPDIACNPCDGSGDFRPRLEGAGIGGIIGRTGGYGGGMIEKKNIGRFYSVCLATIYATLITGMVYSLWNGLHIGLVLLIFLALWIGFYFTGIWTAVDRPAELNRKFPISSKELHRRKKAFYDWLASQGRR
jgi:hypothetical protein